MITGAANAEAALLLIDAHEGVQEQSRRHGYMLNLLGIRQIAVLVNKMDLEEYGEAKFNAIEAEFRTFLKTVGVEPKCFIPISAREGDNIATRSAKMPWWKGQTVVETLDEFRLAESAARQPLRMPIQDIYRFDERRILAGRIESGTLKVGDRIIFAPGEKISVVKTIERWNAPRAEKAEAGESIGITLTEQIYVQRGQIAASETEAPYELSRFKARVFWLGRAPFSPGKTYKLKLATQEVDCDIESIERVLDSSTLETISRPEPYVGRNEVAELTLHTRRPVAFDVHAEIIATGRFVIVDGFEVSGGGIIAAGDYPKRTADRLQKSHNIYWSQGKVTPEQRAARNGHAGRVVWLTGLSASGKSTIATELERELFLLGHHVYVLDGDNMRHGLCSDLGFSPEDRKENIRRIGETAKLFAEAGIICITAFISPYRSDRDLVRKITHPGVFVEVYVNAPLEVCEQRDPKGLYAKARANQIQEFTGVSAPYEPPEKPEIVLATDQLTVAEAVTEVVDYLRKRTS
jgi:bifunctional enzyme CysN/CysC